MKLSMTVRIGILALRRNLLRAALTTLGIVIGVAAVIAMVEIGQGSSSAIQATIASMGANNLVIQPGAAASGGVSYGAGSALTLTPQDADAIAKEVPSLRSVAPVVRVRSQVVFQGKNWVPMYIYGTTPSFLEVRDWENMDEGSMFTDRDIKNASAVAVLGATLRRELFDGRSPLGEEIRLQNVSFRVIGVLSRKGANMMGMDQDDIVLAPWTTIKSRVSGVSTTQSSSASSSDQKTTSSSALYPSGGVQLYPQAATSTSSNVPGSVRFQNVDQILAAASSPEEIGNAINDISATLRDRHRIRPGEPDDFNVRDMTEMSKALTQATGLMTTLLLFVAFISLVVGGVGIMNIMLVSVTERTREIGLRMAVGARGVDILRQFLVEAIVLCLAGGAIGILLGRLSSILITTFLAWPTKSSLSAILVAVFVSAGVGILFGFYPAWKASKLDPIEALRYE